MYFKCICLNILVCHKLSTFDKPFFNLARNIKDHNNTNFFLTLNFWSIFTKIIFCTFAFSGSGSCKSKSHRMSGRKSKWVEVLKIFTTGHSLSQIVTTPNVRMEGSQNGWEVEIIKTERFCKIISHFHPQKLES